MTTKKPKGPAGGGRASPTRGQADKAPKSQPSQPKAPTAPPPRVAGATSARPEPARKPPERQPETTPRPPTEARPGVAQVDAAAAGQTAATTPEMAVTTQPDRSDKGVPQVPVVPSPAAATAATIEPYVSAAEVESGPQEPLPVAATIPAPTPEAAACEHASDRMATALPVEPGEQATPIAESPPATRPEPEYAPEPEPEQPPQPQRPSMFIVHVTPEIAPVAKVGGLADVVFGLAKEQEIRGNHVEVILPKYDSLRYDQIWGLTETYNDLWVPWYGGSIHCTVYFGFAHGRKCFFIEPHSADNFFNRGCIYGFNDDILRFAFFSRAALEFLWKSGKHPDIIHCHDWQTALVPVFLYEVYQHLGMTHPRVCFTIHNFKHQGVTGANLLHATGLNRPEYYFHYDRLRDNHNVHALNLTKGGVVYANFVTTVSPRHAVEAKDQGEGFGLEPTLHIHHQKYGGVLNGIDYEAWNPEIDRYIPFHYTVDNLEDKYKNKIALRDRLLLSDNEKPVVAFIGRLDPQKGLELIRHALFYTLHRNGQFILLGSSPDSQINNYFWGLKHQLNENPDCHLEIGFNEELSHLIYAGADIIIVPSRFEPCGLTQMIAMRYGAIPVVREVGGLADTVFDKDYSHRPLHERNGYMFRDYDFGGMESALGRAISCYYEFPEHFRELIKNAMRYDYSWNHPGQDYMNIYDYIREK